jgi:serine/threonine protein kinase
VKDIFAQLISALQYTHAQGFAHRDIKLENILIDSKGEILLTDWSLCTKWKPGQMHKEYVGSSAYMSPEVMDGKPYEGPELDIWSAGIVLYALLFNVLPFESPTTDVRISRCCCCVN